MVNFWIWWTEFSATSPYLALTLAFWALVAACVFVGNASRLTNRVFRMVMVTLRGWPPAHLDADGDWKPEPKGAQ
jgi:hypothetical protein